MKKILTILLFTILVMVLFPAAALADSYGGSGGIIINTAPSTDLQTSVEALTSAANVTSLTITSDVTYTLSYADQDFISNSLDLLFYLDIADTVSFDANGDGTLGDVMDNFFAGHTEIQSVSIPSATAFGDNVFRGCPLAIELTLGSTVPTVDSNPFSNYSFPTGATVRVPDTAYNAYDNDPQDTAGTAGDDKWFGWALEVLVDSYDGSGGIIINTAPPTYLGSFVGAALAAEGSGHTVANITSLTITSTVNYTLSGVDQNYMSTSLSNLQTLDIADTVFFDVDWDGTLGDVMDYFFNRHSTIQSVSIPSATTFGNWAFYDCTSLSSVSLPSATTFGYLAFDGCTSLTHVNLPSAATFGYSAFGVCTSLSSVSLPSAATFADGAFWGCTSLTSIYLPSAATFGDGAFWGCTSLSSVSLPSATAFGDNVFTGCPLAIELTLGSTVPTVGSSAFSNYSFPAGATVRVPDTAYNAYDSDPQDTAGTAGDDMWFGWAMESYQIQTTNPQTGDSQSAYLWLLMLVPVGFVSAVLVRKRRVKG